VAIAGESARAQAHLVDQGGVEEEPENSSSSDWGSSV
jgi:hypothetical protein